MFRLWAHRVSLALAVAWSLYIMGDLTYYFVSGQAARNALAEMAAGNAPIPAVAGIFFSFITWALVFAPLLLIAAVTKSSKSLRGAER